MKTFEYTCKECEPDIIVQELDKYGKLGWELVQIVPMQRMVQKMTAQGMMPMPEYKIQLYFKKTHYEG